MPRLLQITDTHLVVPPALVSRVLDTAGFLRRAVARLEEALPRLGPLDALLVTGDLSDDGSRESYDLFRAMVAPLGLPVLAIPGNHDLREPMRAAFADLGLFPATGRLNWRKDIGGLRVVGIDTLVEGSGGGVIDGETLAFLDGALAFDGPVLLAMHHPPFVSGIRFMDAIGLGDVGPLAACLERARAQVRIVCGHLHMVATGTVAGASAIVGPSTCSTFDVDFRPDAPVGFRPGAGGFMVHDWSGVFRSTHVPADIGEGPFPF